MPKQLSKIKVTHISLVKAGANGKVPIYKSADADPQNEKVFEILKVDQERGVLYGIVYAPDQVDSQDDFAKAEDIEIAAYDFMKSLNIQNVDKDHDFKNRDAYVAESWIVRKGDSLFPKEPEGSWAVGIKLDSADLKKAAKNGEISGLSMAGSAKRKKVEKSENEPISLAQQLLTMFEELHINLNGRVRKSEGDTQVEEKQVAEAIKKGMTPVMDTLKDLSDQLKKSNERADTLEKELKDVQEQLKKTGQNTRPQSKQSQKGGTFS